MISANIKKLARDLLGPLAQRCLLFGSHARDEEDRFSDYDFLLVIREPLPVRAKLRLASSLRSKFAEHGVDADIVIKTEREVDYFKDKPGHIVRHALAEGVPAW